MSYLIGNISFEVPILSASGCWSSNEEKLTEFDNRYDNYIDNLNESNIGHGEINEKQDIDRLNELDKEFYNISKEALELFMKVKKHNKKKISIKLDSINYLVKNKKFKN